MRNDLQHPEQFRLIREAFDLTYDDAADFFDVSRSTYTRWEKRPHPPSQVIAGVADALCSLVPTGPADLQDWPARAKAIIALGVTAFVEGACGGTSLWRQQEPVAEPLSSEEIKRLREELGWTQTEMARFFGVAQSTVNAWELEPDAVHASVGGVLRLLRSEVEFRKWRLLHADWAPFTEALTELGVRAYLSRRQGEEGWEWREASTL